MAWCSFRAIALPVAGLLAAIGNAVAASSAGPVLAGSAWELVSIQSMDDAQGTLRIADPAAFTLQLGGDGRAALKLDCNRGSASWQATPAGDGNSGQFVFGPIAGTRALCPPPHLDERIVRDLAYVRGYLLRDGKLYLALMADGGIYEWRPRAAAAPVLGDPAQPLAGRVLGQAVHTCDAEELRFYVLRGLTDRFAAAEGITVTKAEIDAFVASTAAALGRARAEAVARRDALKRELAAGTLPPDRKVQVEREIASAEQLIADLAPATGAAAAEERQARAEIAAAFIRQWKINGALQRKYGGRIIFQQAGPEPLDATRRFLEAAEAAGDFAIADPALDKPFWAYYRDDARHSFYKPGSHEEQAAFTTPPWAGR
jgi:heat shock protein HslJ